MRSDLDAAAGIMRGALWGALCWLVVASGVAMGSEPSLPDLFVCNEEYRVGQVFGNCTDTDLVPVAELTGGLLVYACEEHPGLGSCSVGGWAWWEGTGAAGAYLGFSTDYEWVDGPEARSVAGGGGGGTDPEGEEEWTLEDLNLPRFAGVFATFFSICGLFWALGKGVGLIVNFTRRM